MLSVGLPSKSKRQPERAAHCEAYADERTNGLGEVRIHDEHDSGDQLRPPVALLAVDEEHEADATREQGDEQEQGVDGHAFSSRSGAILDWGDRCFGTSPPSSPYALSFLTTSCNLGQF